MLPDPWRTTTIALQPLAKFCFKVTSDPGNILKNFDVQPCSGQCCIHGLPPESAKTPSIYLVTPCGCPGPWVCLLLVVGVLPIPMISRWSNEKAQWHSVIIFRISKYWSHRFLVFKGIFFNYVSTTIVKKNQLINKFSYNYGDLSIYVPSWQRSCVLINSISELSVQRFISWACCKCLVRQ